jgi:hypothetical protein
VDFATKTDIPKSWGLSGLRGCLGGLGGSREHRTVATAEGERIFFIGSAVVSAAGELRP